MNNCEQDGNERASCKTISSVAAKENPGALAGATGANDSRLDVEKPYIWGTAIASLGVESTLHLKPQGWFHIEPDGEWLTITIHRPDCLPDVIYCVSPGRANQIRLELSNEGMAGLIEGAE